MSAKLKKGLGRSFDSLIPSDLFDESFDPTAKQDEKISDLRSIKLSDIQADPDQPRRHFDEPALAELAASITEHGILQPIVVTPKGSKFMIVAGERRFRAAKLANLSELPAIVRTLSGQHKLEVSLIENIQRRDLNPIETATAYQKLRDQFNLTLDQIGQRVGGKSVSAISNTLRLLRLPTDVKQAMLEGKLSEGQARPLIGAESSAIKAILPKIIAEEWSARRIEQYMASLKQPHVSLSVAQSKTYNDITDRLAQRFHAPVRISASQTGKGQIVISFKDAKELERIRQLLDK